MHRAGAQRKHLAAHGWTARGVVDGVLRNKREHLFLQTIFIVVLSLNVAGTFAAWPLKVFNRKPRPAASPSPVPSPVSMVDQMPSDEMPAPAIESAQPRKAARVRRPGSDTPTSHTRPAKADAGSSRTRERLPEPATWAPAPPVSPLPVHDGRTVIVWQDRDSMPPVARACGTSVSRILDLNILTADELEEGQALIVPAPPWLRKDEAWHLPFLSLAVLGIKPDKPPAPAVPADLPKAFVPEQEKCREIWRGVRGRRQIALTFDAGGETDGIYSLLAALKEEDAPATFFVTGQFVQKNPDVVRDISADGFVIHNHSWSHPDFTKLSEESIHAELGKTAQIIADVTGRPAYPYWRPPFGERDPRVLRAAASAGFQSVYWTIDSLDSVGEKKSPEFIVQRVLQYPRARGDVNRFLDGAVILMHVGEPLTAAAVPRLVHDLRQRGFKLVTVDDLMKP